MANSVIPNSHIGDFGLRVIHTVEELNKHITPATRPLSPMIPMLTAKDVTNYLTGMNDFSIVIIMPLDAYTADIFIAIPHLSKLATCRYHTQDGVYGLKIFS